MRVCPYVCHDIRKESCGARDAARKRDQLSFFSDSRRNGNRLFKTSAGGEQREFAKGKSPKKVDVLLMQNE